jgi:hypothetical protein
MPNDDSRILTTHVGQAPGLTEGAALASKQPWSK